MRRVIVGVSGSPGNLPALRLAAHMAGREPAALVAVHAYLPPGGDLADRRYPSPYLRKIWADAATGRLEEALRAAWGIAPVDAEIEPIVVRGETGDVLVRVADDPDDLLVVGAGRRGLVARLGHGRVSRYCVAHARCPVLAVPPAVPHLPPRASSRRWDRAIEQELTAPAGEPPRRG